MILYANHSGTISEASFRRLLSDLDVEFKFIDGPVTTGPAQGVELFFEPPFYTFWEESTHETVLETVKWFNDFLADTGPYDAVMAFSQGCIVIASALLQYKAEGKDPPFKAAIFFCGSAPLVMMRHVGFQVPDSAQKRDDASSAVLAQQADSKAILDRRGERWTGLDPSLLASEKEAHEEVSKGPYRITIPTVHIYGTRDPRYVGGLNLAGLCDVDNRQTYNHGGGHEIPRQSTVTTNIADLVRYALDEAGIY